MSAEEFKDLVEYYAEICEHGPYDKRDEVMAQIMEEYNNSALP